MKHEAQAAEMGNRESNKDLPLSVIVERCRLKDDEVDVGGLGGCYVSAHRSFHHCSSCLS